MKKIVIILAVLVVLGGASYKFFGAKTAGSILSPEEAKAKATEFINSNLVSDGTVADVKDITEEQGLYKITVNVGGQDFDSYLTKDGEKFFPQVLNMTEQLDAATNSDTAAPATEAQTVASKSDKPKVELFVMSECPYGTQIEKGILPVIEALGNKIDFTLKFCDYAMHGEKEVKEELNQYCIQKEQADKFNSYLTCYLEAGDSASCITKAGIDTAKRDACVSATDKQYKVTEKFNDKSTWSNGQFPVFDIHKSDNEAYGVQGSPTLVINGAQISSSRDSASLLSTICSAFNNQPEECSKELSSASPSAGFGTGTAPASGSGAAATCN
jgi:glutaredoxin